MLTCSHSGGANSARRPTVGHALLAGLINASLLAIPLWMLILHGLGVI